MSNNLIFAEHHLPALPLGKYSLTVTQTLISTGQLPAGAEPIRQTDYRTTGEMVISGERWSLPETLIGAVFPPVGSTGDHSTTLPHMMLTRSTLPWERTAQASGQLPWLALLVFNEDEKPIPKVVQRAELADPTVLYQLPSSESNEIATDLVTVIDLAWATLQPLLPKLADLPLLTHVRRVDINEQAVVWANRIPQADRMSTVHLVSLEQRYDQTGFMAAGASAETMVRLVSLYSWQFACVAEGQQIEELLTHLDVATIGLPSINNPNADVFLAQGAVLLPHHLRNGEQTVAWYHGPLRASLQVAAANYPHAVSADSLLRFDQRVGVFDVSYAAAWELGRLLGLQNQQFSQALYAWKSQQASQSVARLQSRNTRYDHLPSFGRQVRARSLNEQIPPAIINFVRRLSLLEGVPFSSLFPDERLLPLESIRFFSLDRAWLAALIDGALSIGRANIDHGNDGYLRLQIVQQLNLPATISGFAIRSSVIAGWSALEIEARSSAGRRLEHLNKDTIRLGETMLLLLFADELASLSIHQQAQTIHFGLDHDSIGWHKTLRNGSEIRPLVWHDQQRQILDVAQIASQMSQTLNQPMHSGSFALQMIEGVASVTFERDLRD